MKTKMSKFIFGLCFDLNVTLNLYRVCLILQR